MTRLGRLLDEAVESGRVKSGDKSQQQAEDNSDTPRTLNGTALLS